MNGHSKGAVVAAAFVLGILGVVMAAPSFAGAAEETASTDGVWTTRPFSDAEMQVRSNKEIVSTRPYSDAGFDPSTGEGVVSMRPFSDPDFAIEGTDRQPQPSVRSRPVESIWTPLTLTLLALGSAVAGALLGFGFRSMGRWVRPAMS